MATRKPSIQPRPTKASQLRLQKQQQGASGGLATASSTPTSQGEPQPKTHTASTATPPKSTKATSSNIGPTDGVKTFMQQQRARLAKKPSAAEKEEEPIKKRSTNVMTGAQRYGGGSETAAPVISNTRNIQIIIKQAKAQGKLNISSRGLTKIPEEVIKMYHVDPNSIVVDFTSGGDAWYDAAELTKFVAGDNAITEIDARLGEEFGALTHLDFRDNKLFSVPDTLKLLRNLTSIQMPYNSFKSVPEVFFELKQLKELDLSHNQIQSVEIKDAGTIEQLDLSYNEIGSFIVDSEKTNFRKLNLGHNQISVLPSSVTRWTKLQELSVNQNKLKYLFSADNDTTLPVLVRLDAANNFITSLHKNEITMVSMPKLVELSLLNNKLTEESLLGVRGAPNLRTLDISSNQLQDIPASVTGLEHLQRLDVRGNQLHALPYELGKLTELTAIQCEGNPMRTFASMTQTQLIESLRSSYNQQQEEGRAADKGEVSEAVDNNGENINNGDDDEVSALAANFTQKVNLTKRLDLSKQQLTELPSDSMKFADDIPGIILLNNNEFTLFPTMQLSTISTFIVQLHLEHNKLTAFDFNLEGVVFTTLKSLKLNNNRIRTLNFNTATTNSFPKLEELTLNHNLLTTLPHNFALPSLKTLSLASNKLDNLTDATFAADQFTKLEILDLSNNDIGFLPPGLSKITTLKELVVYGNRFRVPRPAVVEQGTHAILEFLKRRANSTTSA